MENFLMNIKNCIILSIFIQLSASLCQYRNINGLPPDIFKYWSNYGCYIYTRPDLFLQKPLKVLIKNITYNENIFPVPGIIIEKEFRPFYYLDFDIKMLVEETFKNWATAERWINCCEDAKECCMNVMMQTNTPEGHCPSVWDGWSCFNPAPPATTYEQVCSIYAYTEQAPRCHHYSYKECFSNGIWKDKTDYSYCDITPRIITRTQWHISTLSISIIICLPAVIMLIFNKIFKQQKYITLRNLLISIVIRNFCVILVKSLIILDELTSSGNTVMSKNQWPCKMLGFFEKLSGNIVFSCMLLEGIYLHQLVTNVFRSRQRDGPKMAPYYILTFGVSFATALGWCTTMVLNMNTNCWQVTEGTPYNWIFDTPRLIMLIINSILLIHIVWALWRTFKSRDDEQNPHSRTVKSSLICLPLFGVPFFFLMVHADTEVCGLEQFYYFIYYTIEALQGILIVILHCYTEKEMKKQFGILYNQVKNYISNKYHKNNNNNNNQNSNDITLERRITLDTTLDPNDSNTSRSRSPYLFESIENPERISRFDRFSNQYENSNRKSNQIDQQQKHTEGCIKTISSSKFGGCSTINEENDLNLFNNNDHENGSKITFRNNSDEIIIFNRR